ncbi:hypothetical protein P5673_026871 [Acropora cervicornis]|uniref:Uncharacterized protein n=1 Tax=Acropora cervicornis TaxID=6130 RepID=A0AAD9PZW1_ACRCE|nr:hypothetical protein P5673_026871 [Acropora cervicornis]
MEFLDILPIIHYSIKHIPILHSSTVDLIEKCHKHKRCEYHGTMLCRAAHTGFLIPISHVKKIRKYKHEHKHNTQLIDGMKDYIPKHQAGYQWLVAAIRLIIAGWKEWKGLKTTGLTKLSRYLEVVHILTVLNILLSHPKKENSSSFQFSVGDKSPLLDPNEPAELKLSPVTMQTLIPASRKPETASGT